jgi:hypothetical protein
MATSSLSSEHLLTICKNDDRNQLLSELRNPAGAQVALDTEEVIVDLDTGRREEQFNLKRMLAVAARAGHADTVELLLRFGQQHNVAVWHLATQDVVWPALSHGNAFQVLLKFHAVEPDIFARKFSLGASVLSAACDGGPLSERTPRRQFLGLVRHLMEMGFDPNTTSVRDPPGHLLYVACWQACLEIVECLLEHGAVISGSMSARAAARGGRIDVLDALMRYGADFNECFPEKGIDGPPGSALHTAVAYGQVATVKWLLQHGADIGLRSVEEKTAGDLLSADGDEALKDILRLYGVYLPSPE